MSVADTREKTSVHRVKSSQVKNVKSLLPAVFPWKSFETLFRTFSRLNTLCILQDEHSTLSPPFWWASRAFLWESPRDYSRITDSTWSRSFLIYGLPSQSAREFSLAMRFFWAEVKNANGYIIALRQRTEAQARAHLKWLGKKTTCA